VTAPSDLVPPICRSLTITLTDTPHSVEILWKNGLSDAETSTWQHTTHTWNRHPCLRRNSNCQSLQESSPDPHLRLPFKNSAKYFAY